MLVRIKPPGTAILLENRHLVAERQQIVRHGERGRAGTDAGDSLAVLFLRRTRQQRRDVIAVVRRHTLQAANGDGLLLDSAATARGLAGPVADPAQNSGKNVRVAIHHVRFGELALRDQPDVFGDIGVSRAGPLAVHHSMKVIRFGGIGRFHVSS